MKKSLLMFILTLSCSIFSYSQTSDSIIGTKVTQIRLGDCSTQEIERNPLYVIKFKDKTIKNRLKDKNYEESFLKEIQPKWIESTKILRVSEGLEKYGSLAKDGVILVILKNDSWEKMSLDLQNRFE